MATWFATVAALEQLTALRVASPKCKPQTDGANPAGKQRYEQPFDYASVSVVTNPSGQEERQEEQHEYDESRRE